MVGITITILPIKQNVPYPKQEAKNQDKKKPKETKKPSQGLSLTLDYTGLQIISFILHYSYCCRKFCTNEIKFGL